MSDSTPDTLFSTFKESIGKGDTMVPCFKFVRSLSDEDAQTYLRDLLAHLVVAFDSGDLQPAIDHTYTWQLRAYQETEQRWHYDNGPFAPLHKPLSQARLALLTSSGHHHRDHDPNPLGVEQMSQAEAVRRIADFIKEAPALAAIPQDTPNEALCVRHGGYDIAGAQCDPNVAFPLERLRELAQEGIIGELAPEAYSFVGACAQTRLLRHQGPAWVSMLQAQQIDAALLVPA